MTWLTVTNICVTNNHIYVPFVVMTNHEPLLIHGLAPYSVTRVTRDVPHVEQALLSLQENPNSTLDL
jgi:hypothetical protein